MRTTHAMLWAIVLCAGVSACRKTDPKSGSQPIAADDAPVLVWERSGERVESAPISLTASDGTGLALVSLRARAVIQDPLAFTELHLTFHNPEPRRREGRFSISLPQNAAISRFAMRVGSDFQEGEVVERRRAQAVYEDFLHRKQDPALLENEAGNEFSARVFPIEANADKELIISYSEELAERDTPYALLLQGLPQLRELAVEVRAREQRLELRESNYVPASDLEVRLPHQKPIALRNGELVVTRVAPVLDVPAASVAGLTVLFDTSASRALGFGAQIERLSALLAELQKRAKHDIDVRVIGFDQDSEELYRGPSRDFGLRAKAKLLARDALGASDLGQALAFIAKTGAAHPRVLVVTDGVITAGAEDAGSLREAVTRLAAHGVRRLDVMAEGGIQDRDTLAILTRAGLGETGALLDARAPIEALADRLSKGARDRVEVQVSGASWVYPRALEGLQPGDERIVFAEVPEGMPVQIELVGAGAEAFDTVEVPRPLLERAWARAKIEALTVAQRALPLEAAGERASLERQIVDLSVRNRVVSDYTALLVLETDGDYARFGLSQNALTSILRVGDEGLELWDRRAKPVQQIARDDERWEGARRQAEEAAPVPAIAVQPRAARPENKGSADAPVLRQRSARGSGGGDELARLDDSAARAPASASARPPAPASASAPAKAKRSTGAPSLAEPSFAPPPSAAPIAKREAAGPDGFSSLGALAASSGEGRAAGASARRPQPQDGAAIAALDETVAPSMQLVPSLRLRSASGLASADAARALRGPASARARQCFPNPAPDERLTFTLELSDRGRVVHASAERSASDRNAQACFLRALNDIPFPKPDGNRGSVSAELSWSMQPVRPQLASSPRPRPAMRIPSPAIEDAYSGPLAEVLQLVKRGDGATALDRATSIHADDPADVMGLVALGEALEAQRDYPRAARAYGSLIDMFPARADMRRMASARLERLPSHGLTLAVDSYRRAVDQRPDHPSGHRALAYAQLKQSDRAQAFETLERAIDRSYAWDRFVGVERILREDLALIGAAWLRVDPSAERRVRDALARHGLTPDAAPSTRFVLQWETDANDVDFHIYDGRGGHAYYMQKKLGSGGALYADITTGYGPECFAIQGKARAYPYVMQAHYFARGPMGYGMGKLQVVQHDGQGGLSFAEHPFVIMKDKAFVELARLEGPLG